MEKAERPIQTQSKTDKLYPGEARVTVEGRESKAMAAQIMTVSKERMTERVGLLAVRNARR